MIFKCFEKRTSNIDHEEREKIKLEQEYIHILAASHEMILHI